MPSTDTPRGQFLVYETEDGQLRIDVRLDGETVWLTQQLMADLFQTSKQNVSHHVQMVFAEGELSPAATVKNFLTVRLEGRRPVSRNLDHYNLDMVISVGYRIKSRVATRFRIWATQRLREYIIKGFVLDDERLKHPDLPFNCFADASKPNMGLTSFRGPRVRKGDVVIAKNYLSVDELRALNNLAEQYLVFAEGQALRRIPMHMLDWVRKLDAFLNINDREILTHTGRISHDLALERAESEYDRFRARANATENATLSDFDKAVKGLPSRRPR